MPRSGPIITVNSRKFDGTIRRTWSARLLAKENSFLSLVGEFEKEVAHPELGIIRRGTISYEFFWLDRCYNIFRFHEPEGELRNFYCNVCLPPLFRKNIIDYIDLEIDILVWSDFRTEVLDLEEFAENTTLYGYSAEIVEKASASLAELQSMIEQKMFPFS